MIDAWWSAVVLGLVQGVTEFLPVSSSGHLYLVQAWMGFEPSLTMEVALHGASLVAVVGYFWRDILRIMRESVGVVCDRMKGWREDVGFKLAGATMVTVPVAMGLEHLGTMELGVRGVGGMLLVTAGLVWGSGRMRSEDTALAWWQVVVIGLTQGVAVLPGLSRSGLTVAVALLVGVERKTALRFSFLLSLPTILGAMVFAFADGVGSVTGTMLLGMGVSAVASLGVIWGMWKAFARWWWGCGVYCALLGGALLVWG